VRSKGANLPMISDKATTPTTKREERSFTTHTRWKPDCRICFTTELSVSSGVQIASPSVDKLDTAAVVAGVEAEAEVEEEADADADAGADADADAEADADVGIRSVMGVMSGACGIAADAAVKVEEEPLNRRLFPVGDKFAGC